MPSTRTRKRRADSYIGGGTVQGKGTPVNSVAPAITGSAQVGQTLTATNGTWSGSPTYTRQWRADGFAILGETGATYVPAVADVGKRISVTITATNASGWVTKTSAATAAVIAA